MSQRYAIRTETLEQHRRSNHTHEATKEYASRASPRVCPLSRTNPQQDNISDKGDQPARRRIGLAVRRHSPSWRDNSTVHGEGERDSEYPLQAGPGGI